MNPAIAAIRFTVKQSECRIVDRLNPRKVLPQIAVQGRNCSIEVEKYFHFHGK
jgi:hypothetical protein